MYSYFTIPCGFFKEKVIMAERNPKFCDNVNKVSSSASESKLVFVERTNKFPQFTEEEIKHEKWVKIEEGQSLDYYISNLGRVYSVYSNKILRLKLGKSARLKSCIPQVRICGFPITESAKSWEEKHGSKHYNISSLMCKYFFGVLSGIKEDNSVLCYTIHKNNNVFDNRVSNLLVTKNQHLIDIIRKNVKEITESRYKKCGIFLLRDEYVNKFISKIEKKIQSSVVILHKEDDFVIITSPNPDSLKEHLLTKCYDDLAKCYLQSSFVVKPDLSLCNSKKGKELVHSIKENAIADYDKLFVK